MQTIEQARAQRDAVLSDLTARLHTTGWGDLAFAFIKVFAHKNALFSSEALTDAAVEYGLHQPKDKRHWGAVFRRALKAGVIARTAITYQRRYGHGAPATLWESRVFRA